MDAPLLASRFRVDVDDRVVPVSEVRDLTYVPGAEPPASVTLRRAASADRTFLEWALEPRVRPVGVTLLGPRGDVAVSYLLIGARPTAWHGPELNGVSQEVALETLVLAVDRIDLHRPE